MGYYFGSNWCSFFLVDGHICCAVSVNILNITPDLDLAILSLIQTKQTALYFRLQGGFSARSFLLFTAQVSPSCHEKSDDPYLTNDGSIFSFFKYFRVCLFFSTAMDGTAFSQYKKNKDALDQQNEGIFKTSVW